VSIVVVAMMAAIVVLALGAADVARVFAAASRAQTAADAAALAAAQELALPGGIVTPAETAAGYAAATARAARVVRVRAEVVRGRRAGRGRGRVAIPGPR
jgi:hypothetical protein